MKNNKFTAVMILFLTIFTACKTDENENNETVPSELQGTWRWTYTSIAGSYSNSFTFSKSTITYTNMGIGFSVEYEILSVDITGSTYTVNEGKQLNVKYYGNNHSIYSHKNTFENVTNATFINNDVTYFRNVDQHGNNNFTGSITINSLTAIVGTKLMAIYTGNETVLYQWKKGEAIVGSNSNEYIPFETGSYTVTINATGYNSMTSSITTVIDILNYNPSVGIENIGRRGLGGGIIFYFSENGFTMTDDGSIAYYLEAAPANMDTRLIWASSKYSSNGNGTAIGTGRKNTADILTRIDATAGIRQIDTPAANACDIYTVSGYETINDWFLPSLDELNALYINKEYALIPDSGTFWSSTQQNSGSIDNVRVQSFTDGFQGFSDRGIRNNVRAIRAF
jgi:hypothetical protein